MSVASQTLLQRRAFYYSPLSFLCGRENELAADFLGNLSCACAEGELQCINTSASLWLRHLKWDSRYFGIPTYRLEFVDWDAGGGDPVVAVSRAISSLLVDLAANSVSYYLVADIPSEDLVVLQALGLAGVRLIETRLTYFHNCLEKIENITLPLVRPAVDTDIPNLRAVAEEARNQYDRFHADPFFPVEIADEFLAEYVEQCVRGLADIVLVPANDAQPADAFVCGTLSNPTLCGFNVGKLVLAAVSRNRRGWYRSLNAALLCWMRDNGMEYCVNTTQSTNRAVLHVCEQLGYRYGRASHVFAAYKKDFR